MNTAKGASRLITSVRQLHVSKNLAQSTKEWEAAALKKLQAKQALFQVHNDVPVHLKGGAGDNVFYRVTFLVCGIAGVVTGKLFYELSVPPTN